MTTFTITAESLRQRKRNILLGAFFSVLLVLVVLQASTEKENLPLVWSVLGFVVIANVVNLYRHLRYLRLVRDHRLELLPERVDFWTGGDKTVLDLRDVAGVFLYRWRGRLRHIQVRLKNNRGIRLEGYSDLEALAAGLEQRLPAGKVVDRGR